MKKKEGVKKKMRQREHRKIRTYQLGKLNEERYRGKGKNPTVTTDSVWSKRKH